MIAAPWRSGYAAACKAVYAGSIPAGASRLFKPFTAWTSHPWYLATNRLGPVGTAGRGRRLAQELAHGGGGAGA
jgi:hypothetical protein